MMIVQQIAKRITMTDANRRITSQTTMTVNAITDRQPDQKITDEIPDVTDDRCR